MYASRAASRPFFRPAILIAAVLNCALAGCDTADPHVPAVVRAQASTLSPSPSPSSTQAAALPTIARDGLVPPVMHTVD
ncbi:hypothetical protein ACUXPM_004805 [Ralstonia sp. 151470066-2]|nr:hypothetical protein [Ralstonia insidiosa]MBA9873306.1 hypothetical protein [Ralstonia insidiosa]MBA9915292.1 hypothetical protein [Ralstonia insidiosa]MBA9940250.1 hypothetical protein [Ralstonia insidiosa]MBA9954137.1 hypothetical protein [Ralstonia insidiosa]